MLASPFAHELFRVFGVTPGRRAWRGWTLLLGIPLALQAQSLTLRVASDAAPAGGFAQIKVVADAPVLIAGGTLALDLDPAIFESVTSVAAFSATGDAIGVARVTGTHVEATFSSASAGLGQLPGVPVFIARAKVKAGATASGFVSLSLPDRALTGPFLPSPVWTTTNNLILTPTLISGRMNVAGSLSLEKVSPSGGVQPAGTVLTVDGTGFDTNTAVSGIAATKVEVVSPTRLLITTAGTGELTGAQLQLKKGNEAVPGFVFSESAPASLDPSAGFQDLSLHPLLPLATLSNSSASRTSGGSLYYVQNPSGKAVDLIVTDVSFGRVARRSFSIPAGGSAVLPFGQSTLTMYLSASGPLRMSVFRSTSGGTFNLPAPVNEFGPPPVEANVSPGTMTVDYQTGTSAPASREVRVFHIAAMSGVTLRTTAGSWLKVSSSVVDSYTQLMIAFDPTGLAAGSYAGSITATPVLIPALNGYPVKASTVTLTLNVSAQPTLIVMPKYGDPGPLGGYSPVFLDLSTNGTPAAFEISIATQSGGNWLSADVTRGTTPAGISLRANLGGLAPGYYSGTVTVRGPINSVEVGVSASVLPVPPGPLTTNLKAINVIRQIGDTSPYTTLLAFSPLNGVFTWSVSERQSWLQASPIAVGASPNSTLQARIEPAGLAPGEYRAVISGTASNGSVQVPITLTILAKPTQPPQVNVASLRFVTTAGVESPAQEVAVTLAGGPGLVQVQFPPGVFVKSTDPVVEFNGPVGGILANSKVQLAAYNSIPGHYEGNAVFSSSAGSTSIPVVIDVLASGSAPPQLGAVVNGASHQAGGVAPGEIITLHGIGIGPATTGITFDAQGGVVGSASMARVKINGVDAPIVFGSPNQWNVVVPWELEGSAAAEVQAFVNGLQTEKWTLPVVAAAPGLFTLSAGGLGAAAVLNQDNSVNSAANPAPAGTTIQMFATGLGPFTPPASTGSVAAATGGTRLPVKALFADTEARVTYAGPAPGFVSGVAQVNAVVPSFFTSGRATAIRLQLQAGGMSSPVGVTVWVQ